MKPNINLRDVVAYVDGSPVWYEHSMPRPAQELHDGRSLSHLVRRRRQVRHAWTARFRGYAAFTRGRLPSTVVDAAPD